MQFLLRHLDRSGEIPLSKAQIMKSSIYFVYIITNQRHTVLYIGITNNLERRIVEHQQGLLKGFTKRYNVDTLLYYEEYGDPLSAIEREKQLKRWSRRKKLDLIKKQNPSLENILV